MTYSRKLTRRELVRGAGALAGVALAGPVMAKALQATPHQTKGPFYPVEPPPDTDLDLTVIKGHTEVATGEQILVRGRVYGKHGRPLADATIDVWQANHHGRYDHPRDPNTAPLDEHFQGQGIVRTDDDGYYSLKTIRPGVYPLEPLGGTGWRCRHIHYKVSHEDHAELVTQMYFEGDPLIEQDLEIATAPEDQRHLLISKAQRDDASGLLLYTYDLVLA